MFLFVLVASPAGLRAGSEDRDAFLALARDVIEKVRYCALITVDKHGRPRARSVDPFLPQDDFTVWVATRPVTRKVDQIRNNPHVTLYYFDAEDKNYVTIMGKARLVDERDIKEAKRRDADTDRLYPDFPDDYLLIEITPTWLEGIVPGYRGDEKTWQPRAVYFD